MSIIVPKYRVLLDDTDSVAANLATGLMQLVEPQVSVFWDLIPFGETIRQLTYDRGDREVSARQVVTGAQILTNATEITLTAATKGRVTQGHILYDPTTGERFVLGAVNQSTGVAAIAQRGLFSTPNASAAVIPNSTTLYILAQSELYEAITATSRFEETNYSTNYIQDTTEKLEFSTADLREIRKWGVDKQMRLQERMKDLMKDLNMALYYNVPQATNGTLTAITAGFDYKVEQAGNVVDASASGTADIADLRGVLKTLAKNGVGPTEGLACVMSMDVFHAYEDAGLATVDLTGQPGASFVIGNQVKGMNFSGIGFVPFYADPFLNDDRVRFVSTKHAKKAFYQGLGEGAVLESPRVIDEPSLSTSKVQVSTLQMKWGTQIDNASKVHFILDNTGLNS